MDTDNYDLNRHNIFCWARDKGILKESNAAIHAHKLVEEAYELMDEFNGPEEAFNLNNVKLEMGDCLVVLTIMSIFLDTTLDECLELAYKKISKRTGTMVDGVFVKDD